MSHFPNQPQQSQDQSHPDSEVNFTQQPVIDLEQIPPERSNFWQFLGIVSAVALLVGLLLFANGVSTSTVILSSIALVIMVLCYRYPRQGLWAFLIYLPFAGTISYWIGNDHFTFHLAKDGLYIPALIGLIIELRKKNYP